MHDIISTMQTVFLGGDRASIVIAIAAVVVASLAMRRWTEFVQMTLFALALFALGQLVRAVVVAAPKGASLVALGDKLVSEFQGGLTSVMHMRVGGLVTLSIAFLLPVLVLFLIRSRVTVNLNPTSGGHGGHDGGHH